MKVAVTGATGFVGRHVTTRLLSADVDLVLASRTCDLPCALPERASLIKLDMSEERDDWYELLGKPDILIHLAWQGLPNYRSDFHVDEELPRQLAFLKACVTGGLKHLVVTGTCLEYGMQDGALREDLPAHPCTRYGEAKTRLSEYLQDLAVRSALQLTWLRLFYLYGPGQAATSLYSQLRAAVAGGVREFAMSPGDQVRDFLPIETAAGYICDIALRQPQTTLVNICSGTPTSVVDLVREWLKQWNAAIELRLGVYPYPDYEPFSFWGSTERLDAVIKRSQSVRA